MSTPTSEPTYGARFAEAWTALQAYLSDLDRDELQELATAGRRATVELLARQPEVGASKALERADSLEPEELALKIVVERLEALSAPSGEAWGGRFLAEWRRLGGPISAFRYSVLQELKQAGREDTLRALTRLVPMMSQALKRRLEDATPEQAADLLHTEMRQRQVATTAGIWGLALGPMFFG